MKKLKEEEENSLKEFAKKNGFIFNDPSAKKKELDDIYAEAANFKITKVSNFTNNFNNHCLRNSWMNKKNLTENVSSSKCTDHQL